MKIVSIASALVALTTMGAFAAPSVNVNKHTGQIVTAPSKPASEPSRNTKNDGSKSFVGANGHSGSPSGNTPK